MTIMKKQLLISSLFIFSLTAMDISIIEKEATQESKVSSLQKLCIPAAAKELLKDNTRKQFLEGSRTISADLDLLVGSCIAKMHPVIDEILLLVPIQKCQRRFESLKNPITGALFTRTNNSPDSQFSIQAGSSYKRLKLVDAKGKIVDELEFSRVICNTCWSPDSTKFAVLIGQGKGDGYFFILDIIWKRVIKYKQCFFSCLPGATILNWSRDGMNIEAGDSFFLNRYDLKDVLKIEAYFKGNLESEQQEKQYLKQILLLTWLHDTKKSLFFSDWRSIDISKDETKKEIFSLLPPEIQHVLTEDYSVVSEAA